MKWTNEQQQAIDIRNKNILVAAAAGSGKTAVLVERIKKLILEEKCPVDRMLIVTFTNAAAAEMKEKIQKSINETIESLVAVDAPKEQIYYLKGQLNLLPTAQISTFHSFALDVIRRYFYLINVEPNFQICDTVQETLLKGEAMDQLLEELFEENSDEFYDFLRRYSGDRNENRFREIVENCYNTIRSLPEPFEWLEESVRQLKGGKALKEGIVADSLFSIAQDYVDLARNFIDVNMDIAKNLGIDGLYELSEKDLEQIEVVQDAISDGEYEKLRTSVGAFKLPTLSSKLFGGDDKLKKVVSDNRQVVKDAIKELRDHIFTDDLEVLCHEMDMTYESAVYLQKLIIRYDELFCQKKAEKGVVDFNDIEHFAYEILKDSQAADFYRNKFEHIFIDEYQDSNVIQEALIDLIKRPNNLFMVGDVKQSIYKFRLAEPEIFQKKYNDYKNGRVPDSIKIDLNKNFRSKRSVIDFINNVFENTMEGYDDKAKLYLGDPHGDESYDEPMLYLTQVPWNEDTEVDEELKNIVKTQKEAMAVSKIIKDHLGTTIFDSKKGIKRPLELRDIVILMRGVRNYGDVFHKVLTENGLPAYIDDSEGFFNTLEIDAFLSALYVIDNPKQDIPLLTLMRSEMLGFTIEEMVKIRLAQKEKSYYSAFASYAVAGDDEVLKAKCKEAFTKIEEWRLFSRIMPIDKLIWKILMETGFYIAMGAMPGGTQRQGNLRALTDKAHAYQGGKNPSLYGFIRYIEAIKQKQVSMGQVKLLGENEDIIRIMTIHKSKGLEFPMVIVAGYNRRLNYSSVGKAPLIHKDLGIAFPIVDPKNRCYRLTLLQKIIKNRFRREEIDEEKRILYVAYTRAKDKLVLLGMCEDIDKELDAVIKMGATSGSYLTMTGKAIADIENKKHIDMVYDWDIIGLSKGRKRSVSSIIEVIEEGKRSEVTVEVQKQMDYKYPYEEDTKVRTKYSVSEINNPTRKSIESLPAPIFMQEVSKFSSAARGSIYHSVLQHIDVAKVIDGGTPYVYDFLKIMVQDEMLSEEEISIVDAGNIVSFATSDLGKRIAASRNVQKERRFNFLTQLDGHQIMVRGIIDCFFEEDDGLVIVDYKTGSVRDIESGRDDLVVEKYRRQLELYKEALEKAAGKVVKEMYLYMTDVNKIIKL